MTMSANQAERQKSEYRSRGRYAKVNPCRVCGKSAGVDYFSHKDTDKTIGDQLLVLCNRCYCMTIQATGQEAIEWAKERYPSTFRG